MTRLPCPFQCSLTSSGRSSQSITTGKCRPARAPLDVVQQVEEIITERLPPDNRSSEHDAYVEIVEPVETASGLKRRETLC